MATLANGQFVPLAPAMYIPGPQNIEGGALEAASAKTLAGNARMAEAAKSLGAGQKGAGRKRKMRGGATRLNLNANIPTIPQAGSMPGVSAEKVHLGGVDTYNAVKAGAVGDKLGSLQPYFPKAGGGRTKRHRKAKNGRSHKRTHRRRNSRSTHRGGRSRRVLLKSLGKRK